MIKKLLLQIYFRPKYEIHHQNKFKTLEIYLMFSFFPKVMINEGVRS